VIRILELRSVRGTGGGPEKTILAGAAYADRRKFAVTVCYIRDGRDAMFAMQRRAEEHGVDYVELTERHSFDPSVWPALKRLIRQLKTDIVHAHDYKTNLLTWLLGRRESIIPLSTVHGWTGHTFRERYLYYPLDKRVLCSYPRLIAVSDEIRRELVNHGTNALRVRVVPNGIDPNKFKRAAERCAAVRQESGYAPEHLIIGAVGRLEPQKRFDLLISAFARLREAHPEARLIIAGEGSERSALERQIRRLGLDAECRLSGQCSDIIEFHHLLDLFVQSSVYEGTPNVILEAMAMETPLVATAAGGTAELLRAGIDGLIVEPGNLNALYDGIKSAVDDRAAASVRVLAARARVETDLSFSARMTAVERVYEELMTTKTSSPNGQAERVSEPARGSVEVASPEQQ
jgi:glycosyltransferase involved in cell wall biosynthesis